MKKLTEEYISDYEEAKSIVGNKEAIIIDRIDYIVKTIHKTFNKKLNYWYFDGAREGEVGPVRLDEDYIYLIIDSSSAELEIIDKDGDEIDLRESFFTRWLTEDFEQELIEGKELYKQAERDRDRKAKVRKEREKKGKKALIEFAKKKLSKEELNALLS